MFKKHLTNLERAAVLDRAAEILTQDGKWAVGQLARDEEGRNTDSWADNSCSFCTMGAIDRALWELHGIKTCYANNTNVVPSHLVYKIVEFNDHEAESAQEVVDRLRCMASAAREEDPQ